MIPGGPTPARAAAPPATETWTSRRIRELRPPRHPVDPGRPLGLQWETERRVGGGTRRALTVFLAGAECPFTCVFCDLWRHTLEGPTPPGAIPAQLRIALGEAGPIAGADALKLYNASNFFDARAVPPEDDASIAGLCAGFARVTVECHPRLLGSRAERFADAVRGRLEIALGLETVHPVVFPRLNKGMRPEALDEAVGWARERGIGTRAFVLVGLPWVRAAEFAIWAAASVRHAAEIGVDRVSLIPLRVGNGALDRLARSGELEPVTLAHVEDALRRGLEAARGATVVEADPWDLGPLGTCEDCAAPRIARLREANLAQTPPHPVPCACRE